MLLKPMIFHSNIIIVVIIYFNLFLVVCAKTIANGMPFAAIMTTRDIAQAMNQALPFNTYSSNPVSCAAAMAVLDVSIIFKGYIKYIV